MPIFMSRQPPVVLTLAASSWNSTSPAAAANAAPIAGASAWNAAIRPRLGLAGLADGLVADGPAAALREQPRGGGEGVLAADQADQPRGLPRQEALQAEQAIDVGTPLAAARAGEIGPQQRRRRPARSSPSGTTAPCCGPACRRGRSGRAPLFFEGLDLGLERVLQGPAEEVAAGAQQERLAAVDDLPVRGGVGGGLQFLGQGQGPLDDQALQGGQASRAVGVMGASGGESIRSPVITPIRTDCQNPLAHPTPAGSDGCGWFDLATPRPRGIIARCAARWAAFFG